MKLSNLLIENDAEPLFYRIIKRKLEKGEVVLFQGSPLTRITFGTTFASGKITGIVQMVWKANVVLNSVEREWDKWGFIRDKDGITHLVAASVEKLKEHIEEPLLIKVIQNLLKQGKTISRRNETLHNKMSVLSMLERITLDHGIQSTTFTFRYPNGANSILSIPDDLINNWDIRKIGDVWEMFRD